MPILTGNMVLKKSQTIALHVFIYVLAILTLAPFIWMVLTSFKDIADIFSYPPRWWPSEFHFENYVNAFEAAPFARFYMNSLFVASAVTFGQLITCSMAHHLMKLRL